jgi:hypothetical protein
MTLVDWPVVVNTDFFNVSDAFQDNSITIEYESGRKSVHNKNTRFIKEYKMNLSLNVKSGEYDSFQRWYSEVLGGLSGTFMCPKIGNGIYRFKSIPSFSQGLLYRTASLEIEEIY